MIEILSTDFSVTDDDLIQIFATYGDVKEVRNTSIFVKRGQKVVLGYFGHLHSIACFL